MAKVGRANRPAHVVWSIMDWVIVKLKSGQVQEMVPHIARQMIAAGMAEEYKQPERKTSGVLQMETATAPEPMMGTMPYVRGPRTRRIGA